MVEAVVKVGGSLQNHPASLKNLCKFLKRISEHHRLLIIPGGGNFAELVRKMQVRYKFSNRAAHLMAIQSMEIYGLMLHDLIKGSILTNTLKDSRLNGCAIFLPFKALRQSRELKATWLVTSDSIAAFVASKIGCKKLILVKAVDGICHRGKLRDSFSTHKLRKITQSIVDPNLVEILEKAGITCWIVNGRYPHRIESVLKSKKTLCTVVSPGA